MNLVETAAREADKLVRARYANKDIATVAAGHATADDIPVISLWLPTPSFPISSKLPLYLLDRQSNSLQNKTLLSQFAMLSAVWKTTVEDIKVLGLHEARSTSSTPLKASCWRSVQFKSHELRSCPYNWLLCRVICLSSPGGAFYSRGRIRPLV